MDVAFLLETKSVRFCCIFFNLKVLTLPLYLTGDKPYVVKGQTQNPVFFSSNANTCDGQLAGVSNHST